MAEKASISATFGTEEDPYIPARQQISLYFPC